ncbi:hypothetical protein [Bradyrhizobium sp. YR681]|uniref:hypothetical protein n=1 Tax=Bradyrhizobium sp. YR681 TaxID=1144344 RepID=UPI0012F6F51F|nr:hypothetical protein [Bradyrhizobium sp. YR681]
MIAVLIHWRIRPDDENVQAFLDHWKGNNTIGDRTGLIAEFLSDSLPVKEFPDTTWHLDPDSLGNFRSYVTVGLWNDAEAFKSQVGNYFNDQKPMLKFEKYRRRRVMFDPVGWRIGHAALPATDSPEVK